VGRSPCRGRFVDKVILVAEGDSVLGPDSSPHTRRYDARVAESHGSPVPRGEGRYLARFVAVEEAGGQRPFVSLDDLERLASEDPASLSKVLGQLRLAFEAWHDRTGGVFIRKPPPET
jgi:hypothetical protein